MHQNISDSLSYLDGRTNDLSIEERLSASYNEDGLRSTSLQLRNVHRPIIGNASYHYVTEVSNYFGIAIRLC